MTYQPPPPRWPEPSETVSQETFSLLSFISYFLTDIKSGSNEYTLVSGPEAASPPTLSFSPAKRTLFFSSGYDALLAPAGEPPLGSGTQLSLHTQS